MRRATTIIRLWATFTECRMSNFIQHAALIRAAARALPQLLQAARAEAAAAGFALAREQEKFAQEQARLRSTLVTPQGQRQEHIFRMKFMV